MNELHLSLVREIGKKFIMADMEIGGDKFDRLSDADKADTLFRCYQAAQDALDEHEVEQQLKSIQDIKIE